MTRIVPPASAQNGYSAEAQTRPNSNPMKVDNRRVIDGSGMTQDQYVQATVEARNRDLARLRSLQEKRLWLLQQLRKRPFLVDRKVMSRINEIDEKIAAVQSDVDYNQENLKNCMPLPPPIPPDAIPVMPLGETYVNTGTKMMCPLALPVAGTPKFIADPTRRVLLEGTTMGNIMDFKPMVNIPPMGLCTSVTNPIVLGTIPFGTPKACVPNVTSPWKPGKPNVLVAGQPALTTMCTLQCNWGGMIVFMPEASSMDSAAKALSKKAAEEIAGKALEKGLTKAAVKAGLSEAGPYGVAAGLLIDVGEYGYDVVTGQRNDPQTFAEAEERRKKNWAEMERLWDESEGGKNAGSMISKTFEIGGDYLSAATGGIPVLEHVGGVGDAIVTGTGETIGAIADVGYSGGQSAGASAVIIGSDDHYWDDSAEFGDDADLY